MRYIAIITASDNYNSFDDYSTVINSITDWQEVSEEDYTLLLNASHRSGGYKSKIPQFYVLERPIDPLGFIARTIEDYKRLIEVETKKEEEAKKKRAVAYTKKKDQDAAKKIEKLKKLIAKLEGNE